MEFDTIEKTWCEGLITYREVIVGGHRGFYIEIPAGISTDSMVVDTESIAIYHIRGMGTLYVEAIVEKEIVQHIIDIPSEGTENLITILGTGATYEFRSDDILFLNVLIIIQ